MLDLHNPADVQTVLQLAARADVLVENFRPGTMDTFGLSSDRLRELNPRLIYASVSGFGRTGKAAQRPAYDIIIQALSGLMSITGDDAAKPVRVGTSISDILAGLFTTIGILRHSIAGEKQRTELTWIFRCSTVPCRNARECHQPL